MDTILDLRSTSAPAEPTPPLATRLLGPQGRGSHGHPMCSSPWACAPRSSAAQDVMGNDRKVRR